MTLADLLLPTVIDCLISDYRSVTFLIVADPLASRFGLCYYLGMRSYKLTAVIEREDSGYVGLCPELDIASQGDTVDEARANLLEAVEGFLEVASEDEIQGRLPSEIHVESLEVEIA
jgi:predicted RNase H-like HicB family nuclease